MKYKDKIKSMNDTELLSEIQFQVYDAALKSAFRIKSKHDKCGDLYKLCDKRGKLDLYQRGWELGVEGIRPCNVGLDT